MDPADVAGAATQAELTYFDGRRRKVLTTTTEIPFPEGKLIVSRTDTAGIITHCNQAFVEMSGYLESELLGQPHYILRHPDMPKAAYADLWATIGAGKKWHGYVKNLRKDGCYYWVHAVVVPNVRAGKLIGYTSVRRKPERAKIEAVIPVYADMKAKESA